MAHVFISYVHENEAQVQRLADELTQRGLKIWLDKTEIKPGHRWQDAVAEAIHKGDFFVACFSKEYNKKNKSYMNEEITLAIERLRQAPRSRAWFIPVLFSGEVPNWRIGAGETLHNIQWVELNEINWDKGIQQILRTIQPPIHLRSKPNDNLSAEDVKRMLKKHKFFDRSMNPTAPGIVHKYEPSGKADKQVIIDHTTGLTWQQLGSDRWMTFEETQQHIKKLNDDEYGGYSDWRLPTLEEAMSLMETGVNEHGLHINPIFDTREWIWTADTLVGSVAWVVLFFDGCCNNYVLYYYGLYVRAVR